MPACLHFRLTTLLLSPDVFLSCAVGYMLGTNFLASPFNALGFTGSIAVAVAEGKGLDLNEVLWTSDPADRTSTGNVGFLLIILWFQSTAEIIAEEFCELTTEDDIEVPIVCLDVPNPGAIICEVFETILKVTGLIFSTLQEQADFQDALVDGAEVEAAYENSRNLLQKQCAIFDQAVCRCQDEVNPAGAYGKGCGKFYVAPAGEHIVFFRYKR